MMERSKSQNSLNTKKNFVIKSSSVLLRIGVNGSAYNIKKKIAPLGRPLNMRSSNFHGLREKEYVPPQSEQFMKGLFYVQNFGVPKGAENEKKNTTLFDVTHSRMKPTFPDEYDENRQSMNTTQKYGNSNFFRDAHSKGSTKSKLKPIDKSNNNLNGVLQCNNINQLTTTTANGNLTSKDIVEVSKKQDKKPKPKKILGMKEVGDLYLKNAKAYNLSDLEGDDNFIEKTALAYEKIQGYFGKLGGNYTQANLGHHRIEVNLILSQDFESLLYLIPAQELVYITYNMLLFELIDDETTYFNTVSHMYRCLEQLMIRSFDFDVPKICKKIFSLIKRLRGSSNYNQITFIHLFYNSFNCFGEKIVSIDPEVALEYLRNVFGVIQAFSSAEYEIMAKSGSTHLNKSLRIGFNRGIQEVFKVAKYRALFTSDEALKERYCLFVENLSDKLQQTSFTNASGSMKQYFTLSMFYTILEMIKYPSINSLCSEMVPSFSQDALIKMMLSLIYIMTKEPLEDEEIVYQTESVISNCCKVMETQSEQPQGEGKEEADHDFYFQLYFKLHFDQDSKLVTVDNIQTCLSLAKFINCILKVSGPSFSRQMVKKYWVEFSSILRLYNDLSTVMQKLGKDESMVRKLLGVMIEIIKHPTAKNSSPIRNRQN